jgi:hypothetical protein
VGFKLREEQKLEIDNESLREQELLVKLNLLGREETTQRIDHLIKQAYDSSERMAEKWNIREQYRLDTIKKNEALKLLLEKSKDAMETALEMEEDAEIEKSGGKPKKRDKKKKK